MTNLKILDCTLRDGGYYNQWNFSNSQVKNYLKAINGSNIDVVEIGFRFFEKKKEYGKFAFLDDNYLNKLKISSKIQIAIMINSSDLLLKKFRNRDIFELIGPKKKSRVSIIRFATHYTDVKKVTHYLKFVKELGYLTTINLMQANLISEKKIIGIVKHLKHHRAVDVIYFADSLGNMKPNDIKRTCKIIRKNWSKEIGIHTHDNCGEALKNSVQAYKSGATWIDGTIQGMGRGAGNVTTENLIKFFSKKYSKYNLKSILEVSNKTFLQLKKKYKWGKSLFYKLAAKYNIHPTYIQELQVDNRYNRNEILKAIHSLKKIDARSYDTKKLERAFIEENEYKGKWNANEWCQNKKILIVGQGPSLKNKNIINKIKNFKLKNKCLVLNLNINSPLPEELIDYYISSNEIRIMVDQQKYNDLKKPIILPIIKLKKIKKKYNKIKIYDYGIRLEDNIFKCYSTYSVMPNNLSFGYAISLAIIGKAKDIYLAGFDGYGKNHILQKEMIKTINLIIKNYPKLKLTSITSTTYPIKRNNK